MVVFLLFAVGMAAAAGYAVVDLESDMAGQASEGERALAVARAGLERFVGEHLGIPADSTVYAVGDGNAVIYARRIGIEDAAAGEEIYLLESYGEVVDPVNPQSPARRSVSEYARLHTRSVGRDAAAILSYTDVDVDNWGQLRGNDHSSPVVCAESGSEWTAGIAYRGSGQVAFGGWDSLSVPFGGTVPGWFSSGAIVGSPAAVVSYPDHAAVLDSVGIRWDILTDPGFPIEYDGVRPNYGSLPATEFPVTRVQGNLYAGASWSGRGVLIVTGELRFGPLFSWNGIVIAGELADTNTPFFIRGMLIAGLNGAGGSIEFDGYPYIYYDVCSALAASRSLSYFEPVDGTWWEMR